MWEMHTHHTLTNATSYSYIMAGRVLSNLTTEAPECVKLDDARVCHNITGLLLFEGETFE